MISRVLAVLAVASLVCALPVAPVAMPGQTVLARSWRSA